MYSWEIKNHIIEYFDDDHIYIVDGIELPSITQLLSKKFNKKYDGVSRETLNRAAAKGTEVHSQIEQFYKYGVIGDSKELKNFRFLQKHYNFEVLDNEVPVILFQNDKPVAAGRLDLVLKIDDKVGLADIKRTSVLDKEYLAYQLNLYRLAYQQCYDTPIEFLKGVHLREDIRKFVNIPINEDIVKELIGDKNGTDGL